MKHSKLSTKSKGVITVEAVIVFSMVIFVTIIIFFLGLLLFQTARYQTLANSSAQRAAMIHNIEARDMYIGKVTLKNLENSNPYRFIFDADKSGKIEKINDFLQLEYSRKNLLTEKTNTTRSGSAVPDVENHLLSKRVTVKIHSDFNIPVVGIFKMFGLGTPFEINTYASAGVQEQAELIRNIDCCSDLMKYADNTFFNGKASTTVNDLISKVTGYISKLKTSE